MPQQHSYLHAQMPLVDRQHVKWTGEGGHLSYGSINISKQIQQQARLKL